MALKGKAVGVTSGVLVKALGSGVEGCGIISEIAPNRDLPSGMSISRPMNAKAPTTSNRPHTTISLLIMSFFQNSIKLFMNFLFRKIARTQATHYWLLSSIFLSGITPVNKR